MDSTPMMVCTHSYRMAFPALRAPSVLVATCARMSLMASLADAASPDPSIRSSRSTCSSAPHHASAWHNSAYRPSQGEGLGICSIGTAVSLLYALQHLQIATSAEHQILALVCATLGSLCAE